MLADEKAREREHNWYLANRERVIARVMARQAEKHEEYLTYQKANREANREEYQAKSRRWKAENAERHRESSRQYGRAHKEEISAKRKAQRRALKQTVLDAYGRVCACCGESTFEFLTLDHVNGDGAAHRKSLNCVGGRSHKIYADIISRGFPNDFRILCFNCNSSLGFYGYCPHHPGDIKGVPVTRQQTRAATA